MPKAKGKRVGVQQGTAQETYVKRYWRIAGVDVWADLVSGRLDAALSVAEQADRRES